jgi:hypothetical protein
MPSPITAAGNFIRKQAETIGQSLWKHKVKGTVGMAAAYTGSVLFQNPKEGGTLSHLQFPLDEVSIGGFQTRLDFMSWKSKAVTTDSGDTTYNGGTHELLMLLPMPLALSAQFSGKFSEDNDMTFNRNQNGLGGLQALMNSTAQSWMYKGMGMLDNIVHTTNAAKMSGTTVGNNAPGALYEGQNLRNHNFAWRLTPKSAEEQQEIELIVKALKLMSSSAMMNIAGKVSDGPWLGGRLSIPHTVTVSFLDDGLLNEHLYRTKECFITNLEINYTTQGAWTAHADGSPIETQITMSLKEITPVTKQDIINLGI